MPTPISQYVLKVHSRCDLACDHCYVYEHADQSWRGKPVAISRDAVGMAARRIAEHAAAHGLAEVHVVLHGGEPLLLGKDRMRELLGALVSGITRCVRDRPPRPRATGCGLMVNGANCSVSTESGSAYPSTATRQRMTGTGSSQMAMAAIRVYQTR